MICVIISIEEFFIDNFNIGDIVTGVVTGIENYGVFVSLNENCSGLIHISEISDYFVRNINDYVELNETIKVKIIDIDSSNNHYKLSIKNIKYRNKVKNGCKIVETKSGFSNLEKALNVWILEKNK